MNYLKHVSWLAGLAAAATVANALPAYAEAESLPVESLTEAVAGRPVSEMTIETAAEPAEVVAAEAAPELAEVVTEETATSASLLVETPSHPTFQISDDSLLAFDQAGIRSALVSPETQPAASLEEGVHLAQGSSPYGGVSPAYLGFGGNLGIGDPDSAVGDFAAVVISKISLGPRFALRPNFFISERFTNITVPLTYNFNTGSFAGFRFQPYVGAGVDIPFNGNVALLVNAGADVPISRDFTLNTAANFRVTSGFGLGLTLGVAYNFPFIFE